MSTSINDENDVKEWLIQRIAELRKLAPKGYITCQVRLANWSEERATTEFGVDIGAGAWAQHFSGESFAAAVAKIETPAKRSEKLRAEAAALLRKANEIEADLKINAVVSALNALHPEPAADDTPALPTSAAPSLPL